MPRLASKSGLNLSNLSCILPDSVYYRILYTTGYCMLALAVAIDAVLCPSTREADLGLLSEFQNGQGSYTGKPCLEKNK